MLVNQTSWLFLELEGDLYQNLNVGDLRMHQETQSNARRIRTLIDYLGTYFLQPVHDEGSRRLPIAHRLINSDLVNGNDTSLYQMQVGMQQLIGDYLLVNLSTTRDASSLTLRETLFVDDVTDRLRTLAFQHQQEQAGADISQQNNIELTDENGETSASDIDNEFDDALEGLPSGP
ncbi:hypothetical protein RND71_009789 [Anisodus tanguticus]|uniref:Uncharacterized protein n=1 Tax=Anisodus tanguticus TaxID=243964 RepID=A0AAE1VRJ9_9SOLA|nr:hypothetical protein RND71_009789 [Anisodus tanguticus]